MNLSIDLLSARTVETPNATMRTLASPTTTPSMPVAVWRTEIPAGQAGPVHVVDVDQLVVVLHGAVEFRVDDLEHVVAEGDAIKLPAGATRVITAAPDRPATTLTVGQAGATAVVADREPVSIPWTV